MYRGQSRNGRDFHIEFKTTKGTPEMILKNDVPLCVLTPAD